MIKYALWSCLFFGLYFSATGQEDVELNMIWLDGGDRELSSVLKFRTTFPDPEALHLELSSIVENLQFQGFLESSVDSIMQNENIWIAYLTTGPKYEWAHLSKGNTEDFILSQIRYRERLYRQTPFRMNEISKLQQKILEFLEDNGYPFATVRLNEILIEENRISAALHVEKHGLIKIDTIIVHGEVNISHNYLYNYLQIKPGDLYSEEKIQKISRRIRDLPFLAETRSAEIFFIRDQARIEIFLADRNVSRFNFLLGIVPNSDLAGGKFLLSGEGSLHMINPFGTGKSLFIDARGMRPRSPELKAGFNYPYLLNMPLGIDLKFNLFKNDSFYVDVSHQIGLQYLFTGSNYFQGYFRNRNYNLISVDQNRLLLTKQLPAHLDISSRVYGVELHLEDLDYRLNPRKGYFLTVNTGVGTRRVRKNAAITTLEDPLQPEFEFSSLYDSVKMRSINYQAEAEIGYFFPLGNRSTILSSLRSGWYQSEKIFSNELFRIGGNQLLRGFDEESILASWYNVLTLEYRYFLGPHSYFSLFGDGGYVTDASADEHNYNYPVGLGAGLAFETGAGIFSVNYALGRWNRDSGFQFRNAKIHFGYVSYF